MFELWFQAEDIAHPVTPTTHLFFNLTLSSNSSYNQLRLTYGCERDEQVYGFGAQYSKFNMKGERVPLFLSEQGVGRGLEPLTFVLDVASPGSGRLAHIDTSHTTSLDGYQSITAGQTCSDVVI